MKNSFSRSLRSQSAHNAIAILFLAIGGNLFLCESVSAQLFGARTLGRPLSTRANSAELGSSFRIRRTGGFVGSDRRDARRFIGRSPAANNQRPRSATAGIRTNNNTGGAVNQPVQRPGRNSMYLPRLTLSREDAVQRSDATGALEPELNRRMKANFGPSLQVTLEGRIATLSGTVPSTKTRRIAELIVGFEPGVSSVQNDLQVVGDMALPPPLPRVAPQ